MIREKWVYFLCISGSQEEKTTNTEEICVGRRQSSGLGGAEHGGLTINVPLRYSEPLPMPTGETPWPCAYLTVFWDSRNQELNSKEYYPKNVLMASQNEKGRSSTARKREHHLHPPPTSCFIRHLPRSVSSAMAEGVTSVAIISSSVSREQNVKLHHPFRTETYPVLTEAHRIKLSWICSVNQCLSSTGTALQPHEGR